MKIAKVTAIPLNVALHVTLVGADRRSAHPGFRFAHAGYDPG